jgi:hypothetical protein
MSNKYLLVIVLMLLAVIWLAQPDPAFAQDPGPGVGEDLNDTVDTVLGFIRQITLSACALAFF